MHNKQKYIWKLIFLRNKPVKINLVYATSNYVLCKQIDLNIRAMIWFINGIRRRKL